MDTNVVHSLSVSDIFREEIRTLVTDCAAHEDLHFVWLLPEVVRLERRYQMLERARELLPATAKLERLLGVKFGVSEEILAERVESNIAKQLGALGVQLLDLDPSKVDWARVKQDATSRRPPFERGEKEKGFRDLLIGETFLQLVEDSAATPKVCRLVLLTNDQLLREMVNSRAKDRQNVVIFESTEELRGFVNTLASKVSEEFVAQYREAANRLFFDPDDHSSLYFAKDVRSQVIAACGAELLKLPVGATEVEQKRWTISRPEFASKKGQRVRWITPIRIPLTAFKKEAAATPWNALTTLEAGNLGANVFTIGSKVPVAPPQPVNPMEPGVISISNLLDWGGRRIDVADGKATVNVQWSVTVRVNGTLSGATIDGFSFTGTTWEPR
jgi:hypothetical protein